MPDSSFDFEANFDGSFGQLRALSDEAKEWLDENVHSEPWQWLGPWLCIDGRYFVSLLEGIQEEGFALNLK